MRIGILTYDSPHLKTEQLVNLLRVKSDNDITLVMLPFTPRPARQTLLQHRPAMSSGCHPIELARWWSLNAVKVTDMADFPVDFEAMIVAGARLLPPEVVTRMPIVNAHPGLIPAVRGLDSFKWAIRDAMPLGITLHLIDEGVDLGRHLASVRTPVLQQDSLESLARRHYEMELSLLADFARYLSSPEAVPDGLPTRPARKRMPMAEEQEMIRTFESYRRRFSRPPATEQR